MKKTKRFSLAICGLLCCMALVSCAILYQPQSSVSDVTSSTTTLKDTPDADLLMPLYTVSGKNSQVKYGRFEEYENSKNGVAIDLVAGETITINKIIDVSGLSNSADSSPLNGFVSFYLAPNEAFKADANQVNFTLTDAYDSSNSITLTFKKHEKGEELEEHYSKYTYVTAGASFQPQTGLELSGSGTYHYENGNSYIIHKGNPYGAALSHSMTGGFSTYGSYVGKEEASVGIDFSSSVLYVENKRESSVYKSLVVDLDDYKVFNDLWGGFTTGEVYLSISATNYQSGSCRLVLTSILGVSESSMQSLEFSDDVAPVLTVDHQGYDVAPTAYVNKPYPVYTATALDSYDGETEVDVAVYKDYGTQQATQVTLTDGKFTPTSEGVYTVEYVAKDKTGNVSSETVEVTASQDLQVPAVQLGEKVLSGKQGTQVFVAPITISGGTGRLHKSITATKKDDETISYEVDLNDFSFVPLYSGDYAITYTYGDYAYTETQSYDVTITNGVDPYIPQEITLPKYLLKNGEYQFPTKTGYVFNNGASVEKQCTLFVRQDNGEFVMTPSHKATVTASEKVTLVYQLSDGEGIFRRQYVLPVLDVGLKQADALDLSKYFISDELSSTIENGYILYSTGSGPQQANLEFIKPLLAETFRLQFATDYSHADFLSIDFMLCDSKNPDIEIKVTIYKGDNGNAFLQINDSGIRYDLTQKMFDSDVSEFILSYDRATKAIVANETLSVKLTKTLSGQEFNGFTSEFINLNVTLKGISSSLLASAGIRIIKVNNQTFTGLKNDIIEPEIMTYTMRGERAFGDEVQIVPLYAGDVVDSLTNVYMKVLTPSGAPATSVDGIVLDNCDNTRAYTLRLNEYGRYIVDYFVTDGSDLETYYSYVINVVDKQAPTITLTGKVTEGNVGDTVKIAKLKSSDNIDKELLEKIYLKTPNGIIYALTLFDDEGNKTTTYNSFVAKQKGVYTVYYSVYDSSNNYVTESYTITVK